MSKVSNNSSLPGDSDYQDELEDESEETDGTDPSDEASEEESRKTITIYKSEFLKWVEMKEKGQTWTGLLKMIRKGYEMYTKILSNHAVITIPSSLPSSSHKDPKLRLENLKPPSGEEEDFERNLNSDRTQKFRPKDPDNRISDWDTNPNLSDPRLARKAPGKLPFLAELKEVMKDKKTFQNYLKPLGEEELKDITLNDEEIEKKQELTIQRQIKRLEKEHPKEILIKNLKTPK